MLSKMHIEPVLSALLSRGGVRRAVLRKSGRRGSPGGRKDRARPFGDRCRHESADLPRKTYYAYTNETGTHALAALASDLSQYAGRGRSRRASRLPGSRRNPSRSRAALHAGIGEKTTLVTLMDRVARGASPEIRQVRASYGEAERRIEVAAHPFGFASDAQTFTLLSVQCVAGDGSGLATGYESGGGTAGWEFLEEYLPEALARKAAMRASSTLSARRIPGGRMPLVLSAEAGGTMVHEAIGHGLEADLARQGMSVYKDELGKAVASPLVSIVDDATVPRKRGSYGIDDEGTPGERTVLVENGVLKGFLHDRLSAMKEGARQTGNGRRESYRHKPIPRMSNTIILPGTTPPEEILRSADRGLLVLKMGDGQVNTVTGDFVFAVTEGYRIEKGRREIRSAGPPSPGTAPSCSG